MKLCVMSLVLTSGLAMAFGSFVSSLGGYEVDVAIGGGVVGAIELIFNNKSPKLYLCCHLRWLLSH